MNLKKNTENWKPAHIKPEWLYAFGKGAENWMSEIPEDAIPVMIEGTFDLDQLHKGKETDQCCLYQYFTSQEEGKYLLGISADWYSEVYLNGECCFANLDVGNDSGNFVPEDNPFYIPVKKGKNLLAIRISRGLASWNFACGGVTTPPNESSLLFGPWLTNPDAGRMSVRFLTNPNVAGGVQYRKKGEMEWTTCWAVRSGLRVRTDNHCVDLTGLCPGAEYEYRIILSCYPAAKDIPCDEIYTFRVPDAVSDSVSFVYTADLQFSIARQREIIDKMYPAADVSSCDFMVYGGDIAQFNLIREELVYPAVGAMIDYGCSEKPLVSVRGNHELRGKEAYRFSEYFALPNGKTYGIFRFGSTAFLVLDCWEDKPAESGARYTHFNHDREFIREETEFLNDAMTRPEWTTAKRRIVLAHGATYSNLDGCYWQPFRLQRMTDKWFHGKNPVSKLDLWLSGHSHVYLRSYPGTNILAAPVEQPPAPHRSGENDVYPVLTVGGPGHTPKATLIRVDVKADCIETRSFDDEGKLFDHAVFHNDGTIEERLPIPHFTVPAKESKDEYWPEDSVL